MAFQMTVVIELAIIILMIGVWHDQWTSGRNGRLR